MAILHAQVRLDSTSGLPENDAINNLYFDMPDATVATASSVAADVEAFYNVVPGAAAQDIMNFISGRISRVPLSSSIRMYDVDIVTGAETFIMSLPFTPEPAAVGNPLVDEIAAVLSFHGDLDGSDLDRRKRGRIYVGPLVAVAAQTAADGYQRPSAALQTTLQEAARDLQTAIQSGPISGDWIVWSDKFKVATPITGGWVDDAFDTQRSRGPAPTVRTSFVIP